MTYIVICGVIQSCVIWLSHMGEVTQWNGLSLACVRAYLIDDSVVCDMTQSYLSQWGDSDLFICQVASYVRWRARAHVTSCHIRLRHVPNSHTHLWANTNVTFDWAMSHANTSRHVRLSHTCACDRFSFAILIRTRAHMSQSYMTWRFRMWHGSITCHIHMRYVRVEIAYEDLPCARVSAREEYICTCLNICVCACLCVCVCVCTDFLHVLGAVLKLPTWWVPHPLPPNLLSWPPLFHVCLCAYHVLFRCVCQVQEVFPQKGFTCVFLVYKRGVYVHIHIDIYILSYTKYTDTYENRYKHIHIYIRHTKHIDIYS